ncbi:hypothetical protein ENUP19_0265G0016 [Entamoeba nuttalli]|uniref:WWE domain containing protein n=2 Tax=Entamoeba nuttalli TaxID=412467 RepID=K2GSY5_ENTNP|nr:WWE domain containing protein [Entamoeba nuttalli P19]EKE36967.1 WWE domain containing protein [Entamoeba nuttalli P19]|eukprot:XP_008860707.1 WWE domain containing protein [Entamoeba nuttalli P19]
MSKIYREPTVYYQWEWEEVKGVFFSSRWTPYRRAENKLLEEHYQEFLDEIYIGTVSLSNVQQKKQLTVGDYEIDFKNLKQVNKQTGTTRSIRRVRVEIEWDNIQWCYSGKPCSSHISKILEDNYIKYVAGGDEVIELTLGKKHQKYSIDYVTFVQKNLTTNTYRKLSRVVLPNITN